MPAEREPQPFTLIWPRPETSLDVAISYLNTWDLLAHPPELLRDVESLRRYLAWVGRSTDAALTDRDVERAIKARNSLREAFDSPETDAVPFLNGLLIEIG